MADETGPQFETTQAPVPGQVTHTDGRVLEPTTQPPAATPAEHAAQAARQTQAAAKSAAVHAGYAPAQKAPKPPTKKGA